MSLIKLSIDKLSFLPFYNVLYFKNNHIPSSNLPDIKLKIKRQHPFIYGDLTKRLSTLTKLQKHIINITTFVILLSKSELLNVSTAAEDAVYPLRA